MGKILMFKDADFSAVAVDQVPTGVVVLTPTIFNVPSAIGADGNISTNGSGQTNWRVYYVPMVAGKTYQLSVVWSVAHFHRVGVSSVLPASGVTLSPMIVNQQGDQNATTTIDVSYTAVSDGYLAWQMNISDTISCAIKEWE